MRHLFCWFGLHRYRWIVVSNTCELWACRCGMTILQFADDSKALSEVEWLNEEWKKSEKNHVGR